MVTIRVTNRRSALRWALGVLLGGLLAYNFLSLGLFGITNWMISSGVSGVVTVCMSLGNCSVCWRLGLVTQNKYLVHLSKCTFVN
jgi:hypothetical protein